MSEQQRQHLSALVDEEVDPALAHATVTALASNKELREAWEHYYLIGAGIRLEPLRGEYREIAALVRARIADEPALVTPTIQRHKRVSRLGPFAGAALAASAAFFAVFAVPQLFESHDGTPISPVAKTLQSPPEPFRLSGPTQRWHVDEPALESKLDRLLVTHREQSPVSGLTGFLPYATVVGYEAGR
jgi:sigma-E factor negative regulatory protein RseA